MHRAERRYTRIECMRSHEWLDRRSLALHEAVAAKLQANPQLLAVARSNLERWLQAGSRTPLVEWRRILETTDLADLLALLRATDERSTRLRQSSPFAGVLTAEERQAILDRYESRRP